MRKETQRSRALCPQLPQWWHPGGPARGHSQGTEGTGSLPQASASSVWPALSCAGATQGVPSASAFSRSPPPGGPRGVPRCLPRSSSLLGGIPLLTVSYLYFTDKFWSVVVVVLLRHRFLIAL